MPRSVTVPERAVRAVLRARRANHAFLSEEAAQARMHELALRPSAYGPPRTLRRDVSLDVERRDGWPVYTVRPARAAATGAVVYLHGGGWISEIDPAHWRLVAQIAVEAGTTVVVPIYPLAPVGTAGEVVDTVARIVTDTHAAYGSTRLAGDSAGGQIALSAAIVLRDERDLRLARTVLISPAVDLTWSNPRIPDVQPDDPWLAVPGGRVRAEAWRGPLPLTDPRVSPLFADLAGLGPLTILSGTHDILNPDAHSLLDRARAAGVEAELIEGEGLLHVYPLLPTATGAQARSVIVERVRASVAEAGATR